MFFETTVISKCVPATFRVVAAVISVDGSVFGEMVPDKEARSNMQLHWYIALAYKRIGVTKNKAHMGLA